MTPEQTVRGRLEGQLRECEQRLAIYKKKLNSGDLNNIVDINAYKDAIDAMREHRVTIEQALNDHSY
jgi:hypothetical protein